MKKNLPIIFLLFTAIQHPKKKKIEIREYHPHDKNDVIQLFRLNAPQFFALDEEKDLTNYLDNEIELYYVLLENKKIVGCGGINFENEKATGKISWDILHPLYQRQSLGTKLLTHRIDTLCTMDGIQEITVRTSQFAYKFYEKQGFEIVEINQNYWADGFDMYKMKYRLV